VEKKISIIIPVYNTEKYIERCITSVLDQTYQNIEVICVDDGSTDRSGIILDELSKSDRRLLVTHKQNEGIAKARNLALESATGEYIGFVDSDDYIEKTMYSELVQAMEESCADIATCSYYMAHNSRIDIVRNGKKVPEGIQDIREFLVYIYERDTYKGVAGYLWTRLFRSSQIKNDKGELAVKFNNEFTVAEDVAFIADMNMRCKTMIYVDKPLYYYCQREDSSVHDEVGQLSSFSWIRAYEYIIAKYSRLNIDEAVLDLVKRMYVFRCGRLLELALRLNDNKKAYLLAEKVEKYLDIYVKTNLQYIERIKWIVDILYGIKQMREVQEQEAK